MSDKDKNGDSKEREREEKIMRFYSIITANPEALAYALYELGEFHFMALLKEIEKQNVKRKDR